MINLKLLKRFPERVRLEILKKDPTFNVDLLLELAKKYHELIFLISKIKEQINMLSNLNNQKDRIITKENKEEVKELKKKVAQLEIEASVIEKDFTTLVLSCPNIVQEDVPKGNKESNTVIRTHGIKPQFDFSIKNHVELLDKYNKNTFEFGTKSAHSGFISYEGKLAWLIYKLAMLCLKHNESYGFNLIYIPQLANSKTIKNAGNLPRFKDDLFYIKGNEDLILIPTAEVILSSYCAEKTILTKDLPLRLTSWTRCYRKEAGGYGAHERGIIRTHEFEKIEIFSFTSPEESEKEHQYLVTCVEKLLQKLNLHYQVVLLAAEDTSFSSQKTYDIELWLPGQNTYKEVSSISNCGEFQTRRSFSKYQDNKTTGLLHSLNGSSLALPRLIVALVENWQDHNGNIKFDELFSFLDNLENRKS